jgi:Glycosyl hydrolase family 26
MGTAGQSAHAGGGAGSIAGGSGSIAGGGAGSIAGAPAGSSGAASAGTGNNGGASGAGTVMTGGATSSGGVSGVGTSGGSAGGASAGQSNGGGRGGIGGASAGGQGNTAGSAGTGGTSTGTDCGFTPVTPNATAATRKVLCYLHSIYGNHILSGQEEDNNDNGMNTIFAATGKYPAIRAFDVNNSNAPTQCVDQWNKGGLCMFGYHMGINGQAYNSTTINIGNVLTSGTAENTSFNQDLDRVAQYVQPVQKAGGVAILRMFHEAGKGCNWFWWSRGTSAQWQQLFKYAFNYLTATKGLDNVLWIAPLCGSPDAAYNPGSQYIDLGGADTYQAAGDYQPLTNLFQQTETAFPNMMVALHECGPIPDPAQLKSSSTKWLFFNVWATPYFTPQYNPVAHLQSVYGNEYVISRDRLPSFK